MQENSKKEISDDLYQALNNLVSFLTYPGTSLPEDDLGFIHVEEAKKVLGNYRKQNS